ncbi:hypothetical protein ACQUFH_07905 [Lactococcus lactis]|nr:hypothetical protein [Lactococcus lactis]MBU5242620.1 hypothetical protein [Lactococcus lactis]
MTQMTVEIDKRGAPWAPLLTMERLRPLDCESGEPSMKCEAVPHQIAQI